MRARAARNTHVFMPDPVSDYELVAATAQLPPVSSVLQRLLRVLQDPDSDLEDVTRLIAAETSLSVQVLRLANSVHYGLHTPASSVGEAIQRIGIAEISQLVTTIMTRQYLLRSLESYGLPAQTLWDHTIATAVCAETLASYGSHDRAMAFMAGIFHPIGMVTLDRVAAARAAPRRGPRQRLPEWEQAYFLTTNAEIGERMLLRWKFPKPIAEVVGGRYDPRLRPDSLATASLLHVASALAEKINCGLEAEKGLFQGSADFLEAIGISWEDYAESEMDAAQRLERTRALLAIG